GASGDPPADPTTEALGRLLGAPLAGIPGRAAGALRRVELGFDHIAVAVRADAVTELDIGVIADVLLDLLPVVLVVADLLAVRADRQQSPQLAHADDRLLQLHHAIGEHRLQLDQTHADLHAGAQLLVVERLGDVIVGSRLQPGDDLLLPPPGGQQDDVQG